jgi:hypothetical protein
MIRYVSRRKGVLFSVACGHYGIPGMIASMVNLQYP